MKIPTLFFAFALTLAASLPLQAGNSVLDQKFNEETVSFKIKEAPIQIAFMYVSSLADIPIDTKQVTQRQRVEFSCEDLTAQDAVKKLCHMANLTYELTPEAVVIKPAKLAGGTAAEAIK